jgi:hypothetical protein
MTRQPPERYLLHICHGLQLRHSRKQRTGFQTLLRLRVPGQVESIGTYGIYRSTGSNQRDARERRRHPDLTRHAGVEVFDFLLMRFTQVRLDATRTLAHFPPGDDRHVRSV